MAQSIGKRFETNFKNSISENVLVYRPPDAAQSFNMSSNLRFSAHSPCDFMIYNGEYLWTLELKTVAGKSISFERSKDDKGVIHYYQIENLKKFAEYKNVISGLIIDFRESDHTYFLSINEWDQLIHYIQDRKSFSEHILLENVHPVLINKKKLKVNYRYDIDELLKNTSELYGGLKNGKE